MKQVRGQASEVCMGRYPKERKPRKLVSAEKVLKDLREFIDGDDGLSSAADSYFRKWVKWADARGYPVMPAHPAHIVAFCQNLARRGLAITTIEIYASSIAQCHKAQGLPDPVTPDVRKQLKTLKRKIGSSPKRRIEKLTAEKFEIIKKTAYTPRPRENTAEAAVRARRTITLISLMRDAFLPSGIASRLHWTDISECADGTGELRLEKRGRQPETRFISAETMRALSALSCEKAPGERIFALESKKISRLIADAAKYAGLGPGYGGVSPRYGMAADMIMAGETLFFVMVAGGWRDDRALKHHLRKELAMTGPMAKHSQGRSRQ